jgi:hypothetical protein
MTGRINNDTAESMANAILQHSLKDEAMPLLRRERAMYRALYELHHPPEVLIKMRELQALLKDNQKAFCTGSEIAAFRTESGYRSTVNLNPYTSVVRGKKIALAIEPVMPCFTSFDRSYLQVTGKLSQDLDTFLTDKDAFRKKVVGQFQEALTAIKAFGTYKKLRAGWPEAMPVIEQFFPVAGQTNLPAVSVTELNTKFGLPPEEAGAD